MENNSLKIKKHFHNGMDSNKLKGEDINMLPVVSTIPTHKAQQGKCFLYINGTTYRQYTYMNGDWYYVNLTKV